MSKLKNFVGIDISKLWFDVALIKSENSTEIIHQQFDQKQDGFKKMQIWLLKHEVNIDEETLFCMENTGLYNNGIINYLVKAKANIWVEMPLRVKKAGGFERGSDDKTASKKIAWYAFRYQDNLKLWQPGDSSIAKIKTLITQRDRIINAITQLSVPVNELRVCACIDEANQLDKIQKPVIKKLQNTKQKIETLITNLIKKDECISKKVELVKSIKGVGSVTAIALLVYTQNFDRFDNAKQLACYCGVVPFNKTSGTSIKYKATVSPFANKKLKKLLHLCALSAIKNNNELRLYFERKVAEGKNKMSVINAVRNKLIHRIFAVLRDERMFEDNYERKCA